MSPDQAWFSQALFSGMVEYWRSPTLMLQIVVELLQVGHGLVDLGRILGVDVQLALAQQRHRDRLAHLGQQRRLALVGLGLPEDVPRVGHRRDVLLDLVGAPGDAGGIGRIGDAVPRADVVERVDQRGPDVLLEVGDVVEVDRLDQLAGHDPVEVVGRHLGHVRLHGARRQFGDAGVDVVERRHLDGDVVLLAELLQERAVDVLRVVEDRELAAGLGLHPGRDRLLPQRQRDAPVGAGQRQAAGADRLAGRVDGAARGGGRVAARGQEAAGARQGERRAACACQEFSSGRGEGAPFLGMHGVSPILTDWPVNWAYCNDLGDRVKGGGHD